MGKLVKYEASVLFPREMTGNSSIYEKNYRDGFTQIAYGTGPWVGDKKIAGIFVFFKPGSPQVRTVEEWRENDKGVKKCSVREGVYHQVIFETHMEKMGVLAFTSKRDLEATLRTWYEGK